MTNSALIGVWALKSFNLVLASSPDSPAVFQPLGEDPLGRIVFTAGNYMFCTLTSRKGSEPIQSPSWVTASDDEVLNAARSLTTYCGPFRVFTEDGQNLVSTQVEVALDPNWIGKPQVRRWEVTGNKLILRPKQEFTLPVS